MKHKIEKILFRIYYLRPCKKTWVYFVSLIVGWISCIFMQPLYLYAGSFSGTENNINPSIVNNGGMSGITSLSNELTNTVAEIGISISTFTSDSYYLYSGKLQTVSYPYVITTLSAINGPSEGEIILSWTAPGSDGTIGTCSAYDIRYSTEESKSPIISEQQFQSCDSVSKFSPIPTPQSYGTQQSIIITGLEPGTTYYFAVKSRDTNYNWSFLSNGATTWAAINYPPVVTNLAQYSLSWQNINWDTWINYQQIYTTFTISDPNSGDTLQYNIQFSSYSDFSYLFINSTVTAIAELSNPFTTYYLNTQLFPEGTWYWRINATDNLGISGQYTAANSGNIAFKVDITSPTGQSISSIITYISSCTVNLIPGTDSISGLHSTPYSIRYSTSTEFEPTISTTTEWFSGSSTQVISLIPNTTYYFQVRARDNAMNISDWSSILSAVTVCSPPETAWGDIFASSITITWSASNPDNPPDTIYVAEISTSNNFTGIIYSSITVRSNQSAVIENLIPNTTYYARVIAKNREGIDTLSLPMIPENKITVCSPPNTDWGNVFMSSLTITWSASNPDNPPDTTYIAEISTSNNFTGTIYSSITVRNSQLAVFTGLAVNTVYYARTIAINWSGIGSTTTLTSPDSKSTLCNFPSDVNWGNVWVSSLTITWTQVENPANPDNTIYIAQVSTISNFTGIIYSSQTIRSTGQAIITQLSAETTYYGRLIARNWDNVDKISYIETSTTTLYANLPPFIPSNLGQKRSDTEEHIPWDSWTNNITPYTTFYISDPNDEYTVKFRIQVSTVPSFATNIIDYTSLLINQGTTNYMLTGLSDNTSYYWRVKAIDNTSLESDWSYANSGSIAVKIDTTVPTIFDLSSPSDNQWLNTNNVTFQWAASDDSGSGLNKYQLYIDGELKEDNISPSQTSTTTYISEGNHNWYVKAIDNVNNQQQSNQTWSVNIDTTPPNTFDLTSPPDSMYLNDNNVTFQWADSDDSGSGLNKYQLYIDDALKEDNIPSNQTSTTTYISEGSHIWYIKSVDNTNNIRQSNQTWNFTVEIIPPGEVLSSILPKVVNNGGHKGLNSTTNELLNSVAEIVSLSTFTSSSYYLYPGIIQSIVYPRTITDLSAVPGPSDGEITLTWTAPGADDTIGTCTKYDIRYSITDTESPSISEQQFQLCPSISEFSTIPTPQPYNSPQSITVTGLDQGTTYYFAIKSRDINYSWSFLSNGATAYAKVSTDNIPPSPITTLEAVPGFYQGEIVLSWISPGDDDTTGNITNGRYKIRYSTYTTDDTGFWETSQSQWTDYQNKYQIIWTTNTSPLVTQSHKLTGLIQNVTYYIRVWTRDDNPNNWSDISNGATTFAQITILSVDISTDTLDLGGVNVSSTVISASTITIKNTGNTSATYSLKITTTPFWNCDIDSPGYDVFVLQTMFNDVQPSSSSFTGSLHGLTTDYQIAGGIGGKFAGNQTGENVPVAAERKIWYLLKTPLSTSTTTQQNINFTIKANIP